MNVIIDRSILLCSNCLLYFLSLDVYVYIPSNVQLTLSSSILFFLSIARSLALYAYILLIDVMYFRFDHEPIGHIADHHSGSSASGSLGQKL